MTKFNIASINLCTEAEGPYKRLTIWFQGCLLRCHGCCNPSYQALTPNRIVSIDELVDIISKAKNAFGIEGVTYSGGEPTLQQGLPLLTKRIKALGLGVISFTGRQYEDVKEALEDCDLVLDGSFEADKPETRRRLLGSANQRIILLTDRYKNVLGWFECGENKSIEVNVGDQIVVNGDAFL